MTLTSVPGFRVGHAEVPGGGSGCTVVLGPFRGVVEVVGMATGSRELEVLSGRHLVPEVHALLLTGGSAFGLAAAEGVMAWLEAKGVGFDTGVAKVPLVPAGVIYDLAPGVARPGRDEGWRASEAASDLPVPEGRVGAGAGATVGKVAGPEWASPGGVGSTAVRWGGGVVGALAVVNALGEVRDPQGRILAGARSPEGGFLDTESFLLGWEGGRGEGGGGAFGGAGWEGGGREREGDGRGGERAPGDDPGLWGKNTTLVVVGTDLPLSRADLGRLARMAATALPRVIRPVGTPFDGDLVFTLSTGPEGVDLPAADLLVLGVAAQGVVEEAVRRAVVAGKR